MTAVAEIDQKYIGKRGKVLYEAHHKIVAASISKRDYDLLMRLAEIHKVKVSVYLRAIIADALDDERLHCVNIGTKTKA